MGNQTSTNTNSSLDINAICNSAEYKQFRSKGYQHDDIIQLITNAQKQRQNMRLSLENPRCIRLHVRPKWHPRPSIRCRG